MKSEATKTRLLRLGSFGLFVLLAWPRLSRLDVFMTADEYLWVERTRNFLLFLADGNWLRTFQTGHPGVTTTWLGGLGLGLYYHFVAGSTLPEALSGLNLCTFAPDMLPLLRLPMVAVTLLCLFISVKLGQKLWGNEVAWLSLLLLALDPFYLAHSRTLHHDALVSAWLLVAVLSILVYALRSPAWGYLLLAGVATGLALLSKATALFLLPFTGLVLAVMALKPKSGPEALAQITKRTIWAAMGWGVAASLIVYALWPAMWVDPLSVLLKTGHMIQSYAQTPHANGVFFRGQVVGDPGLLFYGLAILFRLTPPVLFGVALALLFWLSDFWPRAAPPHPPASPAGDRLGLGLLLLAAVGFILFLGLGAKKQERYALPAILMLDVAAAWGLARLWGWLKLWQPGRFTSKGAAGLGLSAVLLLQAATTLPHQPYYLTYYNPLLGGGAAARNTITVGWGEGLDRAAAYLNRQPQAERLQVTTLMHTALAPFFAGNTLGYRPQADKAALLALASDYAILYLPDVQRDLPNPAWPAFIRRYGVLEHVVRLHGLEYAWLYRMPAIKLTLPPSPSSSPILGYHLLPARVTAGQTLTMTLYFTGDPPTPAQLSIPMVDERGQTGFWANLTPAPETSPAPPDQAFPLRAAAYNFIVTDPGLSGLYCPLVPGFPFELAAVSPSGAGKCWYYQPPPPGRGCVQIRPSR
ncbi:MAG: glycosyltransferase family 39 protein [Anaerolineae bacterium]|nr:glycosyltransferase family 39 protein [Anaerolineae bacterium]